MIRTVHCLADAERPLAERSRLGGASELLEPERLGLDRDQRLGGLLPAPLRARRDHAIEERDRFVAATRVPEFRRERERRREGLGALEAEHLLPDRERALPER